MSAKKSPLRSIRQRMPGQSLDDQIKDRAFDDLLGPLFAAIIFVAFASLEWWLLLFNRQPSPIPLTVVAAVAVGYAAFKFWKHVPELRRLKLARDGERDVAETLDELRAAGYRVLHDLPGAGFNIDHVVVGPAGVFTVETKTRSKPARGNSKVVFDGVAISVDGGPSDPRPIVQAKAQATGLRALLKESLAVDAPVRPVVVYPGWWVEQAPGARSEVWVLNPKRLLGYIKNQPPRLTQHEIAMVADHLVRVFQDER